MSSSKIKFRQVFIRVYILRIQSVMMVISTHFCVMLSPLSFSLVQLTPHFPVSKYVLYTDSVWPQSALTCNFF